MEKITENFNEIKFSKNKLWGNSTRIYNYFFLIFSILIFSYVLYKSYSLFFTDDEAWSVMDIRYMNFGYFFGNYLNTHLINSFFLWVEVYFFGYNELALRIHSVLSFLIYAWAVYKMSNYVTTIYNRYLLIVLMVLHPFMLDYFSMARGYALSIACMMLSLYFLYTLIIIQKYSSKKNLYLSFLFGAISVVSCYVMFTFYVSILILYFFLILFVKPDKVSIKNSILKIWEEKLFWGANILFSLAIMMVVLKLNPSSFSDEWPYNSFWKDTVYSIIQTLTYKEINYSFIVYILFLGLIISSVILSMYNLYKTRKIEGHSLFSIILIVIYILYSVQYYVFNIPYLSNRGSIYLYPLIILSVFFVFTQVNKKLVLCLLLFALFIVFNFISNFSLERGIVIVPNDLTRAIKKLGSVRKNGEQISLGVSKAFPATMNFYKIKHELNWISDIGRGYSGEKGEYYFYGKDLTKTGEYDYFIIEKQDFKNAERFQKLRIIEEYPESNIILAKAE